MSIAGLLISLMLAAVAAAIVARPLLQSRRGHSVGVDGRQQQLARQRTYYERILTNIRDLDEDFSTGKIGALEYQGQREAWAQRGIQALGRLDELERQQAATCESLGAEGIDEAIESAVTAYREGAMTTGHSATKLERG